MVFVVLAVVLGLVLVVVGGFVWIARNIGVVSFVARKFRHTQTFRVQKQHCLGTTNATVYEVMRSMTMFVLWWEIHIANNRHTAVHTVHSGAHVEEAQKWHPVTRPPR